MTYSFVEISAAEIALRDADKPMLIAQAASKTPTFVGWNGTGTVGAGDDSEVGYPSSRSLDGLVHLPTRRATSASTQYLVFQFPAPGIEFDWLGILGENSKLFTLPISFKMTFADSADFTTNQRTATLTTPGGTDARYQEESIRVIGAPGTDAIRYTDVEFVRLEFSNSFSYIPEIGDVVFGRRRQLKHKPRTPYDDNTLVGTHTDVETAAGVIHRYTFNSGRRRLEAAINPSDEPYLSDIPNWFRTGGRYGTAPFVWIEDPGTYPERWTYQMLDEPVLRYPVQDFVERTFDIMAGEQGPERFYLDRE